MYTTVAFWSLTPKKLPLLKMGYVIIYVPKVKKLHKVFHDMYAY
jgi:hypothetical protein